MARTDGLLADIEAIYRRDAPRFLCVALAITRDEQQAADAVQEAFATAICKRRSYRRDGPLEAWLWRAVVNSALKLRREPRVEELLDAAAPEPVSNGHRYDIAAAIPLLPPRQRIALFLRYYADLDYETIGRILGIETGTVSATLHAAHRSLRRILQEVPT